MSKLYNKLFQGRRLTWIKLSVKAKCIYANNYSSVFQNAAFRGRYCCYYDNTKLIQTITGILIFVKQKLTHFAYSHFYFISHWPLADTGCQYIIHDLKTISLKLFATMLIRIVMFFSCYLRMCFFCEEKYDYNCAKSRFVYRLYPSELLIWNERESFELSRELREETQDGSRVLLE